MNIMANKVKPGYKYDRIPNTFRVRATLTIKRYIVMAATRQNATLTIRIRLDRAGVDRKAVTVY